MLGTIFLAEIQDILPRRAGIKLGEFLEHHTPRRVGAFRDWKKLVLPSDYRNTLKSGYAQHLNVSPHKQGLIKHLARFDLRVIPPGSGPRVPPIRGIQI